MVIIPGVGCANEKRLRIALDNIRQLEQQFSHAPGYAFECSVGAFVERRAFFTNGSHTLLGESLRKIEKRCYVSYQPGAHFSDFLKTLHPMLVRRGGYGYVLVLLDDVRLGSFELPAALALAAANGVGVSSPVVRNALHFPVGLQNEGERKTLARASARSPASPASVQAALAVMDAASSRSASASWSQWWGGRPSPGVYTDFVEVFATVFDADAWDCWWGMLDTTRLSKGWVYDEQLFHMCSKQRKKSDDADDSSPGGAKQQANAKNRHRLRRSGALLQPQPPFRMAVLPGMEAEHDTNGYYDSSGYCAVLERCELKRKSLQLIYILLRFSASCLPSWHRSMFCSLYSYDRP